MDAFEKVNIRDTYEKKKHNEHHIRYLDNTMNSHFFFFTSKLRVQRDVQKNVINNSGVIFNKSDPTNK